jgi:hypothetical protein
VAQMTAWRVPAWTVAVLHHLQRVHAPSPFDFAHAKYCVSNSCHNSCHNVVKIPCIAVSNSSPTAACIILLQIIQLTVLKNYDTSDTEDGWQNETRPIMKFVTVCCDKCRYTLAGSNPEYAM